MCSTDFRVPRQRHIGTFPNRFGPFRTGRRYLKNTCKTVYHNRCLSFVWKCLGHPLTRCASVGGMHGESGQGNSSFATMFVSPSTRKNVSAAEWMPPSSSTVPGLKFVDEQNPLGPQVKLLDFVGESYVPPPSQQAYVRPVMMQGSQGVQNPPSCNSRLFLLV